MLNLEVFLDVLVDF